MDNLCADKEVLVDHETMEKLYSETNKMAYYTALSILKNEADAQDAMQSSYITAFTKFDQLNDAAAFVPWLKKMVINNCINMLNKKKPDLFKTDEEESLVLDNIPEQNEDFLPEDYIVQEAKRKQIMNIINSLPDMQKTTVLLFYYDELSIKEIAEVMKCGESTVTSRISYAKKYIKKEVELLEKMGDKLYGVVPLPFLTRLLVEDAKSQVVSQNVLDTVWRQAVSSIPGIEGIGSQVGTASAIAKAKTFTKIAVKVAEMSVKTKALIAGAAAVLVVAGVATPIIAESLSDKQPVTPEETADTMSAEQAVAYYEVLSNIVNQYGVYTATKTIEDSFLADNRLDSSGLAYAQLIDFDGDGNKEIYLHYVQPYNEKIGNTVFPSPIITAEVWCWDGKKAVKVYSTIKISSGPGSGISISDTYFSESKGKTYIASVSDHMCGSGSSTGELGLYNEMCAAYGFSDGKFSGSILSSNTRRFSDSDDIFYYEIREFEYSMDDTYSYMKGTTLDKGEISLKCAGEEADDYWDVACPEELYPASIKQWRDKYNIYKNCFSNEDSSEIDDTIVECIHDSVGWVSNDVEGLISSLQSAAGSAAVSAIALKNLPYIGDISKCKMTAAQAKAYIEVLKNSDVNSAQYDENHAALIDVSGDGVPILMMWWGSLGSYETSEFNCECWGYQNGAAVKIELNNPVVSLNKWNGETFLCSESFSLGDVFFTYCTLFRINNGIAICAHTLESSLSDDFINASSEERAKYFLSGALPFDYNIDGSSASAEQFDAAFRGMEKENLIGIDYDTSEHIIGDGKGNDIYLALTRASIAQTADMLSNTLPALK